LHAHNVLVKQHSGPRLAGWFFVPQSRVKQSKTHFVEEFDVHVTTYHSAVVGHCF